MSAYRNFDCKDTISTMFVGFTQPSDDSPNAARLYASTVFERSTSVGISQLAVVTPGTTCFFSYISIASPAQNSNFDFALAVDQLDIQAMPLVAVQDHVRYSTSCGEV